MRWSSSKPAAKVDFSISEEAEAWFERQPREVCIALAMRSALRILPLIEAGRYDRDFAPRVAFPVLRACFVAWAIAAYPFRRDWWNVPVDRAVRAAAIAGEAGRFANYVGQAAEAAAYTSYAIGYGKSASAAAAAVFATSADRNVTTAAIRADAVAIEQGRAVAEIVAAPLWPSGVPQRIAAAWGILQAWMLGDTINNWDPWVQWYERVYDGRPSFGEAFDLAVASLPDQEWNEEPVPAAVNRRIAALLAEHTAPDPIPSEIDENSLPEQTPRAPIFQPNQSGVIDLAPPTAADRLADTAEVRDLYDETREKLDELISLGRNMLGDRLARASDKLRSRMPEAMEKAVEWQIWSGGNTLRSILGDHEAVAGDRDPHPNKLDLGAVGRLRDFVDTFNQLAVADPSLRAHDARRPGPQEHQRTLDEIKIVAEPVAEAATDRNITSHQAGEQLSESAAIAQEAGTSLTDRLAVEQSRDTGRNFTASIVVSAYRFVRSLPAHVRGEGGLIPPEVVKGFQNAAGKAAFAGVAGVVAGAWYIRWEIVQFIVSNADVFRLYAAYAFEQSPGFKQMIDWLEAHVPIEK